MAAKRTVQEAWLKSAPGKGMNPDKAYGYQCKDVIDAYCDALWGKGAWVRTVKPGNANRVFSQASSTYFKKVRNNPRDAKQIPPRGAILCYGGWTGNPYGHVNVVLSSNTRTVTSVEQDGFRNWHPSYVVTRSYTWRPLIGWLIPKVVDDRKPAKPKAKVATVTGKYGAYVRDKATNRSPLSGSKFLGKGAKFQYSAIVRGQRIGRNNKWYRSTKGNYVWAGNVKG